MSSRTRFVRFVAHGGAVAALLCGTIVLTAASSVRSPLFTPAAPIGFVVIVHADNPVAGIDRDDLSKIFLKRLVKWPDGEKAEPIDLAPRQPARLAFSGKVHKKTVGAIVAFWQQQIFSGREVPPAEKATEADVVAFIKTHPGAVGYVTPSPNLLPGVKVLRVRGVLP